MDAEIDAAAKDLKAFKASLESLNAALAPVLSEVKRDVARGDDADRDASTALARARRHIALSYTAVSLFAMYLRTQGQSVAEHAVRHDVARVQDAFMRLRRVEAGGGARHVPKARTKRAISAKEAASLELCRTVFPQEAHLVRAIWGGFDRRDGETESEARERARKRQKKDHKDEKRARGREAEKAQKRAAKAATNDDDGAQAQAASSGNAEDGAT